MQPYLFLLSFCIVIHGAFCAGPLLRPPVHFILSSCYFFMSLVKPPGQSLLWPLFAYCLFSHLNNHLLTFLPAFISILFFPNIRLFILSSTLAVNNSHPSSVHSTEALYFHKKATSSITFEIHTLKSSNI